MRKKPTNQTKHNMQNYINPILRSADPLDVAGGGVDTSYPLIMDGKILKFEICEVNKSTKKDDPNVEMLVYKLKTVDETIGVDRKPIYPGHKVTNRVVITPKGDRTMDMIVKDVAGIAQAVYGKKTDVKLRVIIDQPEQYLLGKMVYGKVGINKGDGNFAPSNTVRLMAPEDVK